MKYTIVLLSMAATLLALSCNDQAPEKKEVVIVQPAPKKEVIVQQPAVIKEPAEKQTSVTLDKNGVKVATKKVNVVVKQ